MQPPKGTIADHWTWRDGRAEVTGWHVPAKRGKAVEEPQPSARGLVATSSRPVARKGKVVQIPLL